MLLAAARSCVAGVRQEGPAAAAGAAAAGASAGGTAAAAPAAIQPGARASMKQAAASAAAVACSAISTAPAASSQAPPGARAVDVSRWSTSTTHGRSMGVKLRISWNIPAAVAESLWDLSTTTFPVACPVDVYLSGQLIKQRFQTAASRYSPLLDALLHTACSASTACLSCRAPGHAAGRCSACSGQGPLAAARCSCTSS